MANLPKGWGKEVADAEETIQRQNVRHGEYLFLHETPVYKETKAGHAMIIEHQIIDAKPNPLYPNAGEPMQKGTKWGYFMPDYGKAKVMLKPNMKAYVIGLLGLDPAKYGKGASEEAKRQLGETIDAMCDERYLARGMLIYGKSFEVKTEEEGTYIGMNWYPVVGENDFNLPSVKARRAEIEKLAAAEAAAAEQQKQGQPAAPGSSIINPASAGPLPPPPGSPPPPPSAPTDPIAAYMAKGWKQHPAAPDFLFIGEGSAYQAKSKADILAGR